MGIRYTTSWARKLDKPWEEWVSGLTPDSRVLIQEFVKRGNGCLDSQYECWRFWPATIRKGIVRYDDYETARYKDGYLLYHTVKEDEKIGDVFYKRVVPFHNDCFTEGSLFVDGHAPIYEPEWVTRNFVYVPYGRNLDASEQMIREKFPHSYHIQVNDGLLFIIFGENVQQQLEGSPYLRYLYSEDLF